MNSQSFVTVFSGSIANQPEQLCNARDLHAALKVGRDFSTWIKERLNEYGFEENQDYILVIPQSKKSGRGGDRRTKDYHLTLDTAKELAMVEKTEVGRQIRRYFIRCEKELRGSGCLKITSAQKQQIQAAVNARVRRTGQTHQAVYTIVHQLAQVASYHDIAAADFDKVMDCLNGEVLDKETPPAANLNDYELTRIAQFLTNNYVMMLELHCIIKPMMMLGASFHGKAERYLKDNLPLLQAVVHGLQRFRLSDPLCAPEFDKHMAYLSRANLQI